ncbi:MAG: DegT/DnrJ/EryC1/StrS aminotransferase family protein [Deltaproteobacteria bacterium]|nr:DegT/DnrJ/EryC1/StrS aminotransferase family protein [Deltaproteobacteria bacterium]
MDNEPYIVFGSPLIGRGEIDAVVRTLESAWIGTGPRVQELQTAMAAYTGAAHTQAVSSCTAALHLSMLAAGIGPGDEVITTDMTFCATANSIVHTGATPVLVDCQRDTMNIDPAAVEAAITPRTKAIVPVHFAGRPVDIEAIGAIARKHGLLVIEDAAHAIAASWHGRKIGSISDLTCFSFYVTKNMTTGEGGMVTTNRPELAEKIRVLGLHGMSADAWSRFSDKGYRHYDVIYPGFKYNLTDIAATLGLEQLRHLDEWQQRREALWQRYDQAFADLPVVLAPPPAPGTVHARHLYVLLLRDDAPCSRDSLMAGLHELRIGSAVHYRPLHVQPWYRERFKLRDEQFPNAHWIGERTVSLPFSPKLGERDIERIISGVRQLLGS